MRTACRGLRECDLRKDPALPVCHMQRVYGSGITAARIVKQHHSEIFHKGGTSVSSATAGAVLYPQSGLPALREGLPFTRAARKDCR